MSSYEKNSFLSIENLNHLGATIEGFLYDTYKIQLKTVFRLPEFQMTLRDMMTRVDAHPSGRSAPMAEKNKQVILAMRNLVLEKAMASMTAEANSATDVVEAAPQGLEDEQMAPAPTPIERISTKTEDVTEDAFMMKLQELEQKRKLPAAGAAPAPAPAAAAHAPTGTGGAVAAPAPAPAVTPPLEHVVVAVPPPPRQGITFVISSWERQLEDNPERAVLRWTTPPPFSSNPIGTSIAAIFLPASLGTCSPYMYLTMGGAGGNQTACLLAPEDVASGTKGRGWQKWRPIDKALSYIRHVATPWVIQLKTADGALMPLGIDHYYVMSIEGDISNRCAFLKLGSIFPNVAGVSITEADFQVGDQIWIVTKTDKKKTEVLGIQKESIQVRYVVPVGAPSISNGLQDWNNGRIMNYHRQWSMVLDMTVSGSVGA